MPHDRDTAVGGDHLTGHRQLGVAACGRRHVDDDRSGAHGLDRGAVQEHRGTAPRDARRSDDDVGLGGLLGVERVGRTRLVGAHLLGVAVGGHLLGAGQRHELRPHGTHLVGDLRAHVGAAHLRAQGAGGPDGGQAGHARADDIDGGGRELAGGGHLPAEQPAQVGGRLNDGAVTGQVRLRGEHVQGLRPRDPGDHVQGQGGDAALAQRLEELGVARRVQPADEDRAPAHQCQVLLGGGRGAHDDLAAPDPGPAGQAGPGGLIGLVGELRPRPGAALHQDLVAQADHPLHRLRACSGTRLIGRLAGDSDTHSASLHDEGAVVGTSHNLSAR